MVTSTDAIKLYNGDGVTTRFPITLEHTSEDDIKVESINNDTGEYTEIVKDTGWTYTVDGEAVYCDLAAALSSDYKLMLSLDIEGTQPVHLIEGAPYVPNVLEKLFDRLTLKDNQIISRLKGALAAPVEEGQEDMRLPPASSRAGKYMYFDAEGKPSVNPNVVANPVSSFMQGVLTQETSKAAKSALETDKNNVNAVAADYVVQDDDDREVIEATGGADGITITLPTLADNAGRVLKILKVDADPGIITIDGEGAETINGEETQVLAAQYEAITVIAGTGEWKVLNAGKKSSLTVAAKSADYTITDTDNVDILEVTTGATDKTITLPTLADNQGRSITIKKADGGDGAVLIDGEGAETIQGGADFSLLTLYEAIALYAGPTEWGVSSYDSKDGVGGEVGDVKWVLHDEEKNGWKNAKYQSKSKTVYAELWNLIGHGYAKSAADSAAAEALGEFRFPDGRYLFPRAGTQSWPLTPSAIDTATYQITITGHGLETDGSQNGRPLKLLRVPGQSPTLPTGTGYTEYDQNFVRVIDADTIELYDTEAHAIDTGEITGRVDWTDAGTGVFKLTTQGCYQANALQGHFHENDPSANGYNNGGGGAGYGQPMGAGESFTKDPINDGIHGDPRLSNETRPSFVSMNMQIKVIGIAVSTGGIYDSEVQVIDWHTPAIWGAKNTIVHGLNCDFEDMIVQAYLRCDQCDETLLPGGFTSTGYGSRPFSAGLKDRFIYEFAANGPRVYNDAGSYIAIGSVTNAQMKYVLTKRSLFAATKTSPLVTVTESGPISIETVEKTAIIPDTVTSSLDITITAGAGINETNCIWIKNKSDEIQHVLFSTQTFWVSPGQKIKFYLDGVNLVWATGAWEKIWEGNLTQVPDSVLLHGKPVNGKNYKVQLYYSVSGIFVTNDVHVSDNSKVNAAPDYVSGTAMRYEGVNHWFDSSSGNYPIQEIWEWHDAA